MAGTSTGGLSTIMLGRMELDVDAALACYDIVGNDVFGKPRLLPKHIPAVSLVGPKIAVAQGRNLSSQARVWTPYLFRSYPHPYPSPYALQPTAQRRHCNPGPAHRTPIHVVARATSAAPTYFAEIEAENHVFKDGGLGNNNPTKMAWDEMQQLHGRAPRVLLSVGTGSAGSGGAEDQRARGHKGPLKNLLGNLDLLELLSNIATETEKVHEWIEEMAAGLSSNASSEAGKTKYYRANVERGVGDKVALDEWVPKEDGSKTKAKIEKATRAYLEKRDVHEMLLGCARELVWVRRRRARTDRWEEFACRVAYYCPEHSMAPMNASWYGGGHGVTCVQGRTFETRDELRRHALEAHSFVHRVPVRVHGSDVLAENPQFMHACYWDHCLLDVAVFEELEAYKTHLRDAHGIENLKFESREELEQWLDRGRMSLKDAFERRESQHARVESRVQQQDGLGEGDRQGEVNVEDREDSLRYNSGSSHSRKPSSSFGAASSTGK
ncbi:uncharacterized protein K452DRAFT_316774 [Neofusicoccum parvum]|nr:uncharacterized protein K452DRAFT_316774 [Neofusicoccum parvum]